MITRSIWVSRPHAGRIEGDAEQKVHVQLVVREEDLDPALVHEGSRDYLQTVGYVLCSAARVDLQQLASTKPTAFCSILLGMSIAKLIKNFINLLEMWPPQVSR